MALTFSRWLAATALISGVVAVSLLPPPPQDPLSRRFVPREPSRLERLTSQLERARASLRSAHLNDAVIAEIRQHPLPPGRPRVIAVGAATPAERARYSEALLRWWPLVESHDSMAIGIVLGGDSADMLWQTQYLLPAVTDGHSCLTMVTTFSWRSLHHGPEQVEQRRFARELGPCLFFGMYGRPGPDIERWLGGRGIDFATYFNPASRTRPIDSPVEIEYPLFFEMEWAVYGTMPLGVQCVNGRVEECASAVHPADSAVRPMRPGFRAPSLPWRAPFGALSGSYLADLHETLGPAAFGKFWRSTLPFDQAFKDATGKELGEWTHQWAVGRRGTLRPGPLPERRSVVRIAGLTVLLLGIAVVYSTRRTVS